jgi:hypothetical protein
MNEKVFEKKLRERIKRLGGIAVKFSSPFYTGMPDRIIMVPGGSIWFVELKSPGRTLSPRQRIVATELFKLGHRVRVIDSSESLENFLKEAEHALRTAQMPTVHN